MPAFTNQATLSYNGLSTTSNIVTGNILDAVTITKTALSDNYRSGDPVTFVLSVINTGTAPLTDLTITDDLGAFNNGTTDLVPLDYSANSVRYFIGGAAQPNPASAVVGNALVISGLNIPAGQNAMLIYEATPNEFAPLAPGSTIVNTASVTGPRLNESDSSSVTLAVNDAPELTIEKALDPQVISENGTLTYTFTIRNTGNTEADAADNIILSDNFDPILQNISVSYNGTLLTSPDDYTYDENTGAFSTVAGRITVPAAQYNTDPVTGAVTAASGTAVVTVTGTV